MDNWSEVAATREFLPVNVESMFVGRPHSFNKIEDADRLSVNSALRKTRSIDASCMDIRSLSDYMSTSTLQMPRAKSEYNLSEKPAESPSFERPIAKALFAYLSSGDNQLSFIEGDNIGLIGERANGWQFGENLRTRQFGWFPVAYTDHEADVYG